MAHTNPRKAILQIAAAESYSKAGTEMKKAEPLLAKPNIGGSKPSKPGHADEKGGKSR